MAFDAIISASCYMRPKNAIRFLASIPRVNGRVLPIITCARPEDALGLYAFAKDYDNPLVILQSDINSRYFCQSIAFVYCIAMGLEARYFAVVDDDVEFIAGDIFSRLDKCPSFSVMGFSSNQIGYGYGRLGCQRINGEYGEGPAWLDANNMWSAWDSNLKYGLPDCATGVKNCAFTEVEYQHRLRMFTAKPTIGCSYNPIWHHSRIPGDTIEAERGNINIVVEGYKLWQEKFGLALNGGLFNAHKMTWEDVYQILLKDLFWPKYKQHLIFGGLWTDWEAIWNKYKAGIKTIYEVTK